MTAVAVNVMTAVDVSDDCSECESDDCSGCESDDCSGCEALLLSRGGFYVGNKVIIQNSLKSSFVHRNWFCSLNCTDLGEKVYQIAKVSI